MGRHPFPIPNVIGGLPSLGRAMRTRHPAANRTTSFSRPAARSRRTRRVHTERSAFLTIVGCWGTGLILLAALVVALRVLR